MWCWCSFPSSWLGGRLGSLILEWWALSKHHCCIIRKKILTLTTHHRFPWKPKPKRSGERRHSDQIILRTRGRRYLQEVARGACWPGFRFHSITEKSPHSKPTYHHQTSTGQNSDSMCSNILYKELKPGGFLAFTQHRKVTVLILSLISTVFESDFCRYVEGSTLYEGSVRNFYSPFESPDASDDDEEVGNISPTHKRHFLQFWLWIGQFRNSCDVFTCVNISWKTVGWGCQGSSEGDRTFPSMLRWERISSCILHQTPGAVCRGVYYSSKIHSFKTLLSSNLLGEQIYNLKFSFVCKLDHGMLSHYKGNI